jgi:hypothetical protein
MTSATMDETLTTREFFNPSSMLALGLVTE